MLQPPRWENSSELGRAGFRFDIAPGRNLKVLLLFRDFKKRFMNWQTILLLGLMVTLNASVPGQTNLATGFSDATGRSKNKARVPGVVIDHVPPSSGLYVGSPSIAVLANGDYLASHDYFGPKSGEHQS